MPGENLNDLMSFITVARERSFTRAAAKLGMSQSALSQAVRTFEAKLGVPLLVRTTRSVAPTEAGERLMLMAAPRLEEVAAELKAISEMRDQATGTIRINSSEHAGLILMPKISQFLLDHPTVNVEVAIADELANIVADRYDIGVRMGDDVAKDMIAMRIGPDVRFVIVGSPAYFADRTVPNTPQQLMAHNCISFRLPTGGGLYAWELQKGDQELRVRVEGQLVLNRMYEVMDAALAGVGLAFIPEDIALAHVASGRLNIVLEEWAPTFPGFHVYYPSRRHSSRAMTKLLEVLRYPS
jgi:DNA-binding transcriptional LysR family regulator